MSSHRTRFAKLRLASSSTNVAITSTRPSTKTQSTYISKFFTNKTPETNEVESSVSPVSSQNSLQTPSISEDFSEPATKRLKIQSIEIYEKPFENDDSNVVNGLETVSVLSGGSKKSSSVSEKDLLAIYAKTSSKISKLKSADKADESVITKFFKDNKADEDDSFADFEPKRRRILPTQAATKSKKKAKAPRITKSDKKKQSDIRKMINKNFSDEQILDQLIAAESATTEICPYELQMAIALSKSILETSSTKSKRDTLVNDGATTSSTGSSNGVASTQERVNSLKHTLEQYGFKCKNSADDLNLQAVLGIDGKKKKKWHKKPTLLLYRNRERQDQIIAGKIQLVLQTAFEVDENTQPHTSQQHSAYKVFSEYLQEFHNKEKFLFRINSNNESSLLDINNYYKGDLFAVSKVKAGHLLKDWATIPGRDLSPDRCSSSSLHGSSFETNWNEKTVEEEELPVGDSKIGELEQHFEYNLTPYSAVTERLESSNKREDKMIAGSRLSSPDLFMQDSSDDESPEFYTATAGGGASEESNYQDVPSEASCAPAKDSAESYSFYINESMSLRKTSSDLCKSIEDIFEMSDEIENMESYSSNEVKTFSTEKNTDDEKITESLPSTNLEIAETPDPSDDEENKTITKVVEPSMCPRKVNSPSSLKDNEPNMTYTVSQHLQSSCSSCLPSDLVSIPETLPPSLSEAPSQDSSSSDDVTLKENAQSVVQEYHRPSVSQNSENLSISGDEEVKQSRITDPLSDSLSQEDSSPANEVTLKAPELRKSVEQYQQDLLVSQSSEILSISDDEEIKKCDVELVEAVITKNSEQSDARKCQDLDQIHYFGSEVVSGATESFQTPDSKNQTLSQESEVLFISDDEENVPIVEKPDELCLTQNSENLSQNSDVWHVSDDEVNYSVLKSAVSRNASLANSPLSPLSRRTVNRTKFPSLSPSPKMGHNQSVLPQASALPPSPAVISNKNTSFSPSPRSCSSSQKKSPSPKTSLDATEIYFDKNTTPCKDDHVFVISDDSDCSIADHGKNFSQISLDQSIANILDTANRLNFSRNQNPAINLYDHQISSSWKSSQSETASNDAHNTPRTSKLPKRKSIGLKRFKSDSFLLSEQQENLKNIHENIDEVSETSDNEMPSVNVMKKSASTQQVPRARNFDDFDELVFGKQNEYAEPSFIDYCNDDLEFEGKPISSQKEPADSSLLNTVKLVTKKTSTQRFSDRLEQSNPMLPGHKDVYFIKTRNIPPKPDYELIELPQLLQELRNNGLKPLKRAQAIKILDHIYYQTHPYLDITNDGDITLNTQPNEEDANLHLPSTSTSTPLITRPSTVTDLMSKYGLVAESQTTKKDGKKLTKKGSEAKRKKEDNNNTKKPPVQVASTLINDDELDELEREFLADDGFAAEMDNEEYLLPSKPRGKTHWCAVPLHLAFHNMLRCNPPLRISILNYVPLDLEAMYKFLKKIGLKYETNDLIAFLDKRCITFRTENNISNGKEKRIASSQQSTK